MTYQTRTGSVRTTASARARQDTSERIFGLFSIATLNRHRVLIATCIGLAAILGAIMALTQTPTYTTSARVMIENRQLQVTNQQDVILAEAYMDAVQVQNQIEVLRSEDMLRALTDRVPPVEVPDGLRDRVSGLIPWTGAGAPSDGDGMRRISDHLRDNLIVARVGNSHAIDVIYSSDDADFAYAVVSELVELYIERAEGRVLDAAQIASPWLRDRVSAVGPNVSVINSARMADRPDGPGPLRVLAMALVLGGMLGGALAFWREFCDKSVRTAADAAHLAGVPCLGVVPKKDVARGRRGATPATIDGAAGRAALSRARRTLGRSGGAGSVIGLAEPAASEDAHLIARELAGLLSQEDPPALLVRIAAGQGSDLERDGVLGIDVIQLNSEELTPAVLRARLEELRPRYQYIVMAFPPLIPGLEVQAAQGLLDDLLLVVRWGEVSRDLVAHSADHANEAGKLRGTILTRVPHRRLRYYSAAEYQLLRVMSASRSKVKA